MIASKDIESEGKDMTKRTVTIKAENEILNLKEELNCDREWITVKETTKKNGMKLVEIRFQNPTMKRAKVFSSGVFSKITMQDDESGEILLQHNR